MGIKLENVTKRFGAFPAVNNITLEMSAGEFTALLGPSGSGKTTLLRLIAGLEQADSGKILFNGEDFTFKNVKERKVGFVFQHYALFQHMTIFDNVAFGMKVKPRKLRPSKEEIKKKVFELLKLVQLEHVADRYPSQLSGGQRQRIALARALAVEPEILLLDEPFGALDAKVRQELRFWLREIHTKLGITSIFVTHDQEEALEMADTVVVMNEGKIEQAGSPQEVYERPVNEFVYRFLGKVNEFKTSGSGQEIFLNRPHEITLSKLADDNSIHAEVVHILPVGSTIRFLLKQIGVDQLFEAEMNIQQYKEIGPIKKGDHVYAKIRNKIVFREEKQSIEGTVELGKQNYSALTL